MEGDQKIGDPISVEEAGLLFEDLKILFLPCVLMTLVLER